MGGRNGVLWPGGGDVDHLVRSPNGLGFAIETKTLTFSQEHLRRTAQPRAGLRVPGDAIRTAWSQSYASCGRAEWSRSAEPHGGAG